MGHRQSIMNDISYEASLRARYVAARRSLSGLRAPAQPKKFAPEITNRPAGKPWQAFRFEVLEESPLLDMLPAWRRILREVAAKHGLTVDEVRGQQQGRKNAKARQEFYYRCSKETTLSKAGIGRKLGKDHTTVIHGIRQHEARIARGEA